MEVSNDPKAQSDTVGPRGQHPATEIMLLGAVLGYDPKAFLKAHGRPQYGPCERCGKTTRERLCFACESKRS